jgi:hypothetical protein
MPVATPPRGRMTTFVCRNPCRQNWHAPPLLHPTERISVPCVGALRRPWWRDLCESTSAVRCWPTIRSSTVRLEPSQLRRLECFCWQRRQKRAVIAGYRRDLRRDIYVCSTIVRPVALAHPSVWATPPRCDLGTGVVDRCESSPPGLNGPEPVHQGTAFRRVPTPSAC